MKANHVVLLSGLLLTLLLACSGGRGLDGEAYLSLHYNSENAPSSYVDNNSATPEDFDWDTDYNCEPGTYDFEYYPTSSFSWEGSYEIWVDHGKEGTYSSAGEDGNDNYFELWCNPDGPVFGLAESVPPGSQGYIIEDSLGFRHIRLECYKVYH